MTPAGRLRVAVPGVGGRMGRALATACADDPRFELAAATARPGSPLVGSDVATLVGGAAAAVRVDAALPDDPAIDVVVDFTLPAAVPAHLEWCLRHRIPLVLGVTALDAATELALAQLALQVPVVQAANFSIGISLLQALLRTATRALGPEADVEIVEMHHRHKRDAPSGTAIALGEAVAEARGTRLADVIVNDRHGADAPRSPGSIGMASLRGGEVVGDHTVVFATPAERLEFTHRASGRATFAAGALAAAAWLCRTSPAPGRYDMSAVLGLGMA